MKTKHLKLIMELIFIFIIPLILICGTSTIEKTYVYDNSGNYQTSQTELSFDNSIIKYSDGYKNIINDFNVWNEDWEDGSYNIYGSKVPNDETIRSKDKINVIPQQTYYFHSSTNFSIICLYYNDTFVDAIGLNNNSSYTIPSNVNQLAFALSGGYGNTYKNDTIINISVGWANGNYVPYGRPLILITDTDVSGQNNINYTAWGNIKNLLVNNLELNDSILLDLIICYTILWFLMFILWHFFYLFFDGLVHLFIDWKKRSD